MLAWKVGPALRRATVVLNRRYTRHRASSSPTLAREAGLPKGRRETRQRRRRARAEASAPRGAPQKDRLHTPPSTTPCGRRIRERPPGMGKATDTWSWAAGRPTSSFRRPPTIDPASRGWSTADLWFSPGARSAAPARGFLCGKRPSRSESSTPASRARMGQSCDGRPRSTVHRHRRTGRSGTAPARHPGMVTGKHRGRDLHDPPSPCRTGLFLPPDADQRPVIGGAPLMQRGFYLARCGRTLTAAGGGGWICPTHPLRACRELSGART